MKLLIRNYENPGRCRKHPYRTEGHAFAILRHLLKQKGREESAVYKCPKCGSWHLTSRWE